MDNQEFQLTLRTNQPATRVYEAINNVWGWWSGEIRGNTQKVGDEFVYRYKDMHYSLQKVVELIPGRRIAWLVTNSNLSFVPANPSEWTDTTISFDITEANGSTQLNFTHQGLHRACACFDACSQGWTHYITHSLLPLINDDKGLPG